MKSPVFIVALSLAVACHRNATKGVRPMTSANAVAYGDCVEARKRAAAQPDLEVDRLPTPRSQRPSALVPMPDSVRQLVDQKGAVIKIDVVIDTLGRADVKTVKAVEVSHPWFTSNFRRVVPQWRFSPAVLAGCKVPRVYKFSATAKPKAKPRA